LYLDKENWLASRFGRFISASGRPVPYSTDSDTFRCVMLIMISIGRPSYCIELKVMSVVEHLFESDTNFTPFVMRFLIDGLTYSINFIRRSVTVAALFLRATLLLRTPKQDEYSL